MGWFEEQDVPIYRGKLIVLVAETGDEVRKLLPKYEGDSVYASAIYSDWNGIECYSMVLNPKNKSRKISYGVIAHESVHLAHMIAQTRGFAPDFENDEPISYLVEMIFDFVVSSFIVNNTKIHKLP